jgi:hypothetical protein
VASVDEELVNDSDSDEDCIPQISSSEDSDDENDISDSGPGPSVDGFCKKDRQPSTVKPLSIVPVTVVFPHVSSALFGPEISPI